MFTALARKQIAIMLACAIMGAIGGATFAVILLGHEVDRLTLDNVYLMDEVERMMNRIELLDTRGPMTNAYVEAIEITAEGVERARAHIEQTLKQLLAHLVGEEIERINVNTIHRTLERTLTVDQQQYSIQVRYIHVATALQAHVIVHSSTSSEQEQTDA